MGCGSSRADDSRLLRLCRERKDLLRAAAKHRFSLANAHVSYFQALRRVGDALHRFAEEELATGSPVLTIPSSEGKGAASKSRSLKSSGGGDSSPVTSFSRGQGSHLLLSEDSHLPLSSEEDDEQQEEEAASCTYNMQPPPPLYSSTNLKYHHGMHSSGISSIVYHSPYPGDDQHIAYGYNDVPTGINADYSSVNGPSHYAYLHHRIAVSPPPPPAPEVSGWDFLDPFGTYEQIYYSQDSVGSVVCTPNWSEVRAREGIPDLEDEKEQESLREVYTGKKVDSIGKSSNQEDVKENSSDKGWSKGSVESDCISLASSVEVTIPKNNEDEMDSLEKKEVISDAQVPSDKGRVDVETDLTAQGTRDIREIVEEIKVLFNMAAVYGEELRSLLEVGKSRYRPRRTKIRVFSSRLFFSLRMLLHTCRPLVRSGLSVRRTLKFVKASQRGFDKVIFSKFCDLSSTLDKLYAWEKKLYKEVKVEEKARLSYEKKFKVLRSLDNDGAESDKIDSMWASIRRSLTRIDILIKSIGSISIKIQRLRDDELQPQISELVSSLTKMWKVLLCCHQQQFQAIAGSNAHNLLTRIPVRRISVAKATLELEAEIWKWISCFCDWISTQKSYVEALNGWLSRCLDVEPEVTPDGLVPFSPARYGAPAVFITCNDWYQVLDRVSEDAVTRTMCDYAKFIHELWENQNAEERQKLKTENHSDNSNRRLASLQKGNYMPLLSQPFDPKSASVRVNTGVPADDQIVALSILQKRLNGETAMHEEMLKGVHRGLIPVSDALGAFSSEMLKAYETIRLSRPNEAS